MTFDLSVLASMLIAVLALALALAGYRMLKGPGYADRVVALDMPPAVVVSLTAVTPRGRERPAVLGGRC